MHIYISHVLSHISAHAFKRCRKAVAKGDCQLMRVCSSACPAVSPAWHSATHRSSVLLRADTAHDSHTHPVAIIALLCEVRCEAQEKIYDMNITLELMDYGFPAYDISTFKKHRL
jgi:hypothetical protein